mmetsp:Transcript_3225/g.7678  ORF Transcript_3225/g.7678 Transcript_3225/m.7678 type:complete len:459 (+) Transcript_3225:34-1410(+)
MCLGLLLGAAGNLTEIAGKFIEEFTTEDGFDGEGCGAALSKMFDVEIGMIEDEAALMSALAQLASQGEESTKPTGSVSVNMLGRSFEVPLETETSVRDFKATIAALQAVPVYEQELTIKGKYAELRNCDKVQPGAALILRLRTKLDMNGQDAVDFLDKCPEAIATVERMCLDFHGAQLPDAALLRTLATWTHLKHLDIDLSNKNVGVKGCNALAAALRGMDQVQTLRLRLQCCGLNTDACLALGDGFRGLSNLTKLILEVPANSMTTAGCAALAEAIGRIVQLRVLSLHVGGNQLSPKSCGALASGLKGLGQLDDLTLHLGGNTISHTGCAALAVALADLHVENLRLHLAGCELGIAGCKALAEGLSHNETVTGLELGLARNSIQDAACCALAEALESMVKLRTVVLDLNANAMKDTGCAAVGAALRSLPDLEGASVFCIGNPAAPKLAAHMQGVPSL